MLSGLIVAECRVCRVVGAAIWRLEWKGGVTAIAIQEVFGGVGGAAGLRAIEQGEGPAGLDPDQDRQKSVQETRIRYGWLHDYGVEYHGPGHESEMKHAERFIANAVQAEHPKLDGDGHAKRQPFSRRLQVVDDVWNANDARNDCF